MIKKIEPIEVISTLYQIKSVPGVFPLPYSDFLKMVENIENAYISIRVNAGYAEFMKITRMYENMFIQIGDSISSNKNFNEIKRVLAIHSPSQDIYNKLKKILDDNEKDT